MAQVAEALGAEARKYSPRQRAREITDKAKELPAEQTYTDEAGRLWSVDIRNYFVNDEVSRITFSHSWDTDTALGFALKHTVRIRTSAHNVAAGWISQFFIAVGVGLETAVIDGTGERVIPTETVTPTMQSSANASLEDVTRGFPVEVEFDRIPVRTMGDEGTELWTHHLLHILGNLEDVDSELPSS